MDIHIYKKGKYIRTDRNVESGVIDIDSLKGSISDYTIEQDVVLPPTRWPEGAEL